jgi:hypothetical protein
MGRCTSAFVQFALGAALAPLAGVAGTHAALPMALTMMLTAALAALAVVATRSAMRVRR